MTDNTRQPVPTRPAAPLVQLPELLELAWLAHGWTTRQGGVSQPPHATLNMGYSRPDDPAAVRENRRRAVAGLGFQLEDAVVAAQIHGTGVARVGAAERGRGAVERDTLLAPADGLVTDTPGLLLLSTYADCVPLLLVDPARRAVGVAHAGWRGTVADMGGAAVRAMRQHFGTAPAELIAAIGPSIGPCCYEVGPEVVAAARQGFDGQADELLPARGERTILDLWAANELALRRAGVRQVLRADRCTACDVATFFSHRAEHGQTGRFAALVGVRP